MTRLPFTKLSGAGNDFILLDAARARSRLSWPALARRLCPRRVAIGADGLLVARRRAGALLLDYYNADGSRAFCGNGSRCAAWWMRLEGWANRRFSVISSEGPIECVIAGRERVRVSLPEAGVLRRDLEVRAAGRSWRVDAVRVGVPHAVVRVSSLDSFPVLEMGRALRRAGAFAPEGANVNFIRVERKEIRVRTYERGVEDETLACGTGAVASALAASARLGLKSPVSIRTRGGLLRVIFRRKAEGFSDLWLEGPARVVYRGEVTL